MDGKTAAAQRCNLSNLVELLRSSARLIRNGALADRGATGLVLRRKGEQIVWESHGLDPVKWSRKLSPAERAAFINETGIDLGDQPLPIGPPETSDELHAHLWRAFIFGMRLRSPEVGSPPSAEELETCADTLARFDRPGSESSFGLTAPREAATTPTRAAAGDGVVPPGGSASTAPSYLADVRAFVATADACVVEVERWRQEDGHFVSPGLDRRWRTPFESMHRLYSEKIAPLCQCPLELPKDQGPFDWVREHHADGEDRIMLNQDCGHVVARLATERAEHDTVKIPAARVGDAKALLARLRAWLAGFEQRDPGGMTGGGKPEAAGSELVPQLVAGLEARVTAVETIGKSIAHGLERVSQAIESNVTSRSDDPPPKLPALKPWAMEAWRARQAGMTVTKIAETLAKKYGDPKITQPRVSEQLALAQRHAEASGLAGVAAMAMPLAAARAPARTFDPAAGEQGKRTDGKAHHLRERERQKAKDGGNDDDEK